MYRKKANNFSVIFFGLEITSPITIKNRVMATDF